MSTLPGAFSGRVVVALDFETASPGPESACAIGMVRVVNGQPGAGLYSLIRPPSSRIMYTRIHGLTWEMLKDAPSFVEIWPQIAEICADADCLLAHNASFDSRVLRGAYRFAGIKCPDLPFLCSLKGARAALDIPSRSLDNVCRHFGIKLEHHNALSDARASALIYLRLLAMGLPEERMRLY